MKSRSVSQKGSLTWSGSHDRVGHLWHSCDMWHSLAVEMSELVLIEATESLEFENHRRNISWDGFGDIREEEAAGKNCCPDKMGLMVAGNKMGATLLFISLLIPIVQPSCKVRRFIRAVDPLPFGIFFLKTLWTVFLWPCRWFHWKLERG